ncbi:MAG: thioesterase [Bacillota bacterium]|nr:thioesterase [Bacillota bacterium]
MKPKFEYKIRLHTEHVDGKGKLRLDSMLQIFQEISIAHVSSLGMPSSFTMAKNLIWVIGKERIEIERLPQYEEEISVRTWPGKRMIFIFPRYYEIADAKGHPIIRATSYWTLINFSTRKVADPVKEGIEVADESRGDELACPMALRFPELEKKTVFEPKFTDLDINGHVNNTKYMNVVQDLLPNDFLLNHDAKAIDIHWKKEIKIGDSVEIKYGLVDGAYCFGSDHFLIKIQY